MTTVVMTGATSGIGAVALSRMVREPGVRVLVGARGTPQPGTETLPLDLASLASVREFAGTVAERLGDDSIDALVLNAGASMRTDTGRTADGFEVTFAVNHLAHYDLLRLLTPRLASGAVVVITTSATHDPAAKTILPPPRHADAELLAHPDRDPQHDTEPRAAAGRAYASSKLCNVLTVRAFAALPEAAAHGWRVIAYDPGPTGGTGLLRDAPAALRIGWRLLGTRARMLMPRFNSLDVVGGNLADIALSRITPPDGQYHARVAGNRLTWVPPSDLAQSDDAREGLWRDSAKLLAQL